MAKEIKLKPGQPEDEQNQVVESNEQLLDSIISAADESLIPWEECSLPSGGFYYGWPDGTCKVRPMTQAAEKILANKRLAQSGQSVDYLFKECCQFPDNFEPSELLVGDRTFLLFYIRGITHGNMYEFAATCPSCDSASTYSYDLNELISTVIPANPELGEEPFKLTLPYISEKMQKDIWVELRFLRAYDINNIIQQRRMRKKMFSVARSKRKRLSAEQTPVSEPSDDITDNIEKIVVSVLGVRDSSKIKTFVDKLHARDSATIREWLKDNTPGIDSAIEVVCPSCDEDFSIDLPITDSFFRPAKRRRA